jgi:hypothetical protein
LTGTHRCRWANDYFRRSTGAFNRIFSCETAGNAVWTLAFKIVSLPAFPEGERVSRIHAMNEFRASVLPGLKFFLESRIIGQIKIFGRRFLEGSLQYGIDQANRLVFLEGDGPRAACASETGFAAMDEFVLAPI